jgi:hypothetical protein
VVYCRLFGKRTCKPNSVQNLRPVTVIPLGEALPLTLISDLPGGSGVIWSSLTASGRCRVRALLLARASLPIWSCSVWGLPCLRHYCRSGALLPHLFTLTIAWSSLLEQFRGMAVFSLWHWPSTGFEACVPDVIRHTALRSSDFPPPHFPALAEICGSDRPVLLPWVVYSESMSRGDPEFITGGDSRWVFRQSTVNSQVRESTGKSKFFFTMQPNRANM